MWLTHRFGSVETLDRARYWLTRHGFDVARSDSPEHEETRLGMSLELSEVSAALALIDSIERADVRGWPGLFDQPSTHPAHGADPTSHADSLSTAPARSPIHWQAHSVHPPADPVSSRVSEYMFGRWE